jgi:predicted nucleotidyltransferase component of viral defense system
MIDPAQIKTIAAQSKVDPGIVEKDYVLSKALMALSQNKEFQESFTFKGGTALKKCYYPQWRFSEDIDLTATIKMKPKDIKSIFQQSVEHEAELFGVPMRIMEYSQYPKTGNDLVTAQLKLAYDGPLRKASGQKNNIRVDISLDENIYQNPIKKAIIKNYNDDIDASILTYTLEEIIAEKLRSILQRGKSRDYYDIWILLKNYGQDFSAKQMIDIMQNKCHDKSIDAPTVDDFFQPERIEEAARYWERGLAHQVSNLANFQVVIGELRTILNKIKA